MSCEPVYIVPQRLEPVGSRPGVIVEAVRAEQNAFPVSKREMRRRSSHLEPLGRVEKDTRVVRILRLATEDLVDHESHPGHVAPLSHIPESLGRERPRITLGTCYPRSHCSISQEVRGCLIGLTSCNQLGRFGGDPEPISEA